MKVIIAEINHPAGWPVEQRLKFVEVFLNEGLAPPVYAFSCGDLQSALEKDPDTPVLLFSNFPPNSSYRDERNENFSTTNWLADSYSRTATFFEDICKKYNFVSIQLVTGAPEKVLSDQEMERACSPKKIRIIRKKKWISPASDFYKVFSIHVMEQTKKYLD